MPTITLHASCCRKPDDLLAWFAILRFVALNYFEGQHCQNRPSVSFLIIALGIVAFYLRVAALAVICRSIIGDAGMLNVLYCFYN